jgi:hypothetical protein
LIRDDGLGCGVGGGNAIAECLVLPRRFDECVPVSRLECCSMSRRSGGAGALDVAGQVRQPSGTGGNAVSPVSGTVGTGGKGGDGGTGVPAANGGSGGDGGTGNTNGQDGADG